MSEWLDVMLGELERRKQEQDAAVEEAQRRARERAEDDAPAPARQDRVRTGSR